MKYLSTILICILLLIGGCKSDGGGGGDTDESIPAAGAEDYTARDYASEFMMWDRYETPFADADKMGTGDLKMCWAAVAANLLTWAGWAADEDDVFEIFRAHYEDEPGFVYDALGYYFDIYEPGFTAAMFTVRAYDTDIDIEKHKLFDFIVSAVHMGKGVAMKIAYPDKEIGHFLTIYGYGYADEDNFILYIADSDDGLHQIQELKVKWNEANNRWEIQNFYPDWYLVYVLSLARS